MLLVATACVPGRLRSPKRSEATGPPVFYLQSLRPPREPVVALERFIETGEPLVGLRSAPGGSAWYVIGLAGRIWRYTPDGERDRLVLDISDETFLRSEQGLLDFVIAPDGKHAYVNFTGRDGPAGNLHLREYPWRDGTLGEPAREVLEIYEPEEHHNGGQLQFGPDGHLYIAVGDGGVPGKGGLAENDPYDRGQRTDDLLGDILRIDPRPRGGRPYTVPRDNPFVGKRGRDEIWDYGLRNPWRFSFDRGTGDLWISDVGHIHREEVDFEPARSRGGRNYGWGRLEGTLPYRGRKPPRKHVLPVFEYRHRVGCAIIGGYVYRGTKIPSLVGWYVFGDFCNGTLHAIEMKNGVVVAHRQLGPTVPQLTSFAEGPDGELFAISKEGVIYRIVAAS